MLFKYKESRPFSLITNKFYTNLYFYNSFETVLNCVGHKQMLRINLFIIQILEEVINASIVGKI